MTRELKQAPAADAMPAASLPALAGSAEHAHAADRPGEASAFASLREHAWLSGAFVLSRVLIHLAGLRFNFILEWMWLSDPQDLRDRLISTLYYFHAFPPGMDLLTGLVLKAGGAHAAAVAALVFAALGLLLVNCLYALCRGFAFPARVALPLALAFSLIPPSIYFENLYLYETPIAALLCASALLFRRALRTGSAGAWFAFFLCSALVGWTRSTFHLLWFAALLAFALWRAGRPAARRLLRGAAVPALLLFGLYLKNYLAFGLFDAFSFGPVSLNLVTVSRLEPAVRERWIREHKLSPFAAIHVFAGPRAYLPFFATSRDPRWPPDLNRLERPTLGAPNYNHWFYLTVNRARRADTLAYLKERPLDYPRTVLLGARALFGPTTRWHPHDRAEDSPHHQHRQVLGGYENLYNRLLHRYPFSPLGLYAALPFALIWAILRAHRLSRQGARAEASLLYFLLFQIGYVIAASSLFTFQESSRYRYQIEAFIWLVAAMALRALLRELRSAEPA